MAKLDGLKELATAIFDNMPVRIARPREFESSIDVFKDPANSCAIGLCLYGAGYFTPYEIDSERKLRYKDEMAIKPNPFTSIKELDESVNRSNLDNSFSIYDNLVLKSESKPKAELDLKIDDDINKNDIKSNVELDKVNSVSKVVNYFKNLF